MFKLLAIAIVFYASLISISATPVKAQGGIVAIEKYTIISPHKLLKLARQGRFKTQVIPSYGSLNSAIKSGRVTAKSLVTAAVKENRLPQAALEDTNYLSEIDNHL
ncbi:MAG: hypothetical protein ACFCAD_02315 [Pleurocapsa sp.]